jgi:glycyl-tRNA synthetase (class II)
VIYLERWWQLGENKPTLAREIEVLRWWWIRIVLQSSLLLPVFITLANTDHHIVGVAGLYDYGPPGSSLEANIISEWRKHFIIDEHMLELSTTVMTPASVFEASGHVARFADWMVKDTKTGDVLRADHLVKNVLEARLAGDKEARGIAAAPPAEDEKKRKKKSAKAVAVKLEDTVVQEYEALLAQVRRTLLLSSIALYL